MHRVVWSVLLLLVVLGVRRRWAWLPAVLRTPSTLASFIASAAVLSLNWFLYVWSVGAGRVVDASLGYFINPLFSVALGALLLKERLSPARRLGVALAGLGVLWLTIQLRQIPWIGLGLAASFGTYGLLRKTAALETLEGLALETMLLLPVAAGGLGWLVAHGESRFVGAASGMRVLIVLAGPITVAPLLLFAAGARRIPLSLVGMLQYIGPTLQLLVGVVVEHEPFGGTRLVGYALIWLGFGLASAESLRGSLRRLS
jgi:chloramphenicol-sensitive protein RarD